MFHLKEADENCKIGNTCTIIVSLMTKGDTWKNINIGFKIYSFETKDRFKQNLSQDRPLGSSGGLERFPQVTKRFDLAPGRYVIIPFTEHKDQESEFLLRIFSEKSSGLEEFD